MQRLLEKQNGITIIEVMITLIIISVGIMGSYQVASQGNSLERMSENRTRAVAYAREGLEIVENIRDTNWLKFSSNYEGCFDVHDYDVNCIGTNSAAPGTISRIIPGSYIISKNSIKQWILTPQITGSENEMSTGSLRNDYIGKYPVYLDSSGNTVQSGSYPTKCKNDVQTNCNTNFTREIRIARPGATNSILNPIQITSIVTWVDGKQTIPYVIKMEYTLYNWKYNFYKQ